MKDTQVLLGAIRLVHLEAGVDLTNGRHEVRDERLQLGLELDLLRFIARYVFEQLLDLVADLQAGVIIGIVRAGHMLVIIITVIVFIDSLLGDLRLTLQGLRFVTGSSGGVLLSSLRPLHIVHVDLVVFLFGLNLLTVIDVDSEIIGLILELLALDIGLGALLSAGLLFASHILRLDITRVINVLAIIEAAIVV